MHLTKNTFSAENLLPGMDLQLRSLQEEYIDTFIRKLDEIMELELLKRGISKMDVIDGLVKIHCRTNADLTGSESIYSIEGMGDFIRVVFDFPKYTIYIE